MGFWIQDAAATSPVPDAGDRTACASDGYSQNAQPPIFSARSGLRFYSPGLGSWLSRDPKREAGGVNLYCYVRNDSLNALDALGQQAQKTSIQGFTAAGSSKPYTSEGPLDKPPEWDWMRADSGQTASEYTIKFGYRESTSELAIVVAKHSGKYWFKNERGRAHEQGHEKDAIEGWRAYFDAAVSLEGYCSNGRKEAECYAKAADELYFAAVAVRIHIAAKRHTEPGPMQYDAALIPGELASAQRLANTATDHIMNARRLKNGCDLQFRKGKVDQGDDYFRREKVMLCPGTSIL